MSMRNFVFCGLALINTSTTGVVRTFGKFTKQMNPGLNFYIPLIQQVSVVSNRLCNQSFEFQIKSKDNVFAKMGVEVQHRINEENSATAFFSLNDPHQQIDAYVENVIRSSASRMTIDEIFEAQDTICRDVSSSLALKMSSFGYNIENVLVTNIDPDPHVKEAMNKINASKRLFEAAKFEADAKYITSVREAEADRDRKRLQGEGISLQRRAIVDGYRDGVEEMSKRLGISHEKIIDFVLETQKLDTMEHIGRSTNTKTIFVPYDSDYGSRSTTKQRVFEGTSLSNEI